MLPEVASRAPAENKAPRSVVWNVLNMAAFVINTLITYTSITGAFGETNSALSRKYQTLVTPSGFAFSIWGPIFIFEGAFAVAQLLPRFRGATVVRAVTPWWLATCVVQCAWTIAFAQDAVAVALVLMLGILTSLLGLAVCTDGLKMSVLDYALLRAPFSLHLGWIIAASAVSINVQADAAKSSAQALLCLAVLTYAGVSAIATVFAVAVQSPDPIVCLVAAWAFLAIQSELGDPQALDDEDRFNAMHWDRVILDGLRRAAVGVSIFALCLAVLAAVLRARAAWRQRAEEA